MSLKVAVLGCGPAGLMAAHAVKRISGGEAPIIYSRKVKSMMFGAMYLHQPIPGISPSIFEPEFIVHVMKTGRRDGYAKLVYGDPKAPCSWDDIKSGNNPAWNLHAAYNTLWDLYEGDIVDTGELDYGTIYDIINGHDIVFSTVPLKSICYEPTHEFCGQEIWVAHMPAEGFHATLGSMMYYNGYPPDRSVGGIIGPPWYRFSQICGYQAWEYAAKPNPYHIRPKQLSEGIKPLSTTCDCFPQMQRLGRFGKWQKGVLTHHAYQEAEERMVKVVEGL